MSKEVPSFTDIHEIPCIARIVAQGEDPTKILQLSEDEQAFLKAFVAEASEQMKVLKAKVGVILSTVADERFEVETQWISPDFVEEQKASEIAREMWENLGKFQSKAGFRVEMEKPRSQLTPVDPDKPNPKSHRYIIFMDRGKYVEIGYDRYRAINDEYLRDSDGELYKANTSPIFLLEGEDQYLEELVNHNEEAIKLLKKKHLKDAGGNQSFEDLVIGAAGELLDGISIDSQSRSVFVQRLREAYWKHLEERIDSFENPLAYLTMQRISQRPDLVIGKPDSKNFIEGGGKGQVLLTGILNDTGVCTQIASEIIAQIEGEKREQKRIQEKAFLVQQEEEKKLALASQGKSAEDLTKEAGISKEIQSSVVEWILITRHTKEQDSEEEFHHGHGKRIQKKSRNEIIDREAVERDLTKTLLNMRFNPETNELLVNRNYENRQYYLFNPETDTPEAFTEQILANSAQFLKSSEEDQARVTKEISDLLTTRGTVAFVRFSISASGKNNAMITIEHKGSSSNVYHPSSKVEIDDFPNLPVVVKDKLKEGFAGKSGKFHIELGFGVARFHHGGGTSNVYFPQEELS